MPLLTAVGKPRFSGISSSWASRRHLRDDGRTSSSPEALSTTTISVGSPVRASAVLERGEARAQDVRAAVVDDDGADRRPARAL